MVNEKKRHQAAQEFVEAWRGYTSEKSGTQQFWLSLLRDVVGMKDTTTGVHFEELTDERGYIDVVIPDAKTFIEQKSGTVDLDKQAMRQGVMVTPFEQALRYANTLPNPQRPDRIIVCNFQEFRIHDLTQPRPAENYLKFSLEELPDQLSLLDFLVDPQKIRRKREEKVSMDAGYLIGKLYSALRTQYVAPDSKESQHALNVLCVRLVFCLFAEDAGLFEKDAFYSYLKGTPADLVRSRLIDLFKVLDTPYENRDLYLSDQLKKFPYVNGGLFRQADDNSQVIPHFTDEILKLLVEEVSQDTNWSEISPTIFGGVFESTLNPETRAKGGMHYTSPENIHRVIDPLFLDALRAELAGILDDDSLTPRKRNNRLRAFHDKISSLTFFDPACGSGNFLTETYLSLRRIENKILSVLYAGQTSLGFEDVGASPLKVSLSQFYGLEINDFAVSVASTALWIAQLQSNAEAEQLITTNIDDLPLKDAANIEVANALEEDWEQYLKPEDCDYIIGNPPFLGARNQTPEQKAEIKAVFPAGTKNVGNIDYVAGWFVKSAQYMGDHPVRAALVSTNSLVQGEQVANIWHPMMQLGIKINFAHNTFRWTNEAADQAHVFCVIVGFSKQDDEVRLYHYSSPDAEPELRRPARLNPYLADGPDVFVWNRSKPLSDLPKIGIGNKPIDDGNYLFEREEMESFVKSEPYAERFFHPWIGSREFLQGKERWVLWLGEASASDFKNMPLARQRVENVKMYRAASTSAPTRKIASTPTRFHVENMPLGTSIVVPKVSSERRKYIPLGFIGTETFASDLVFLIPDASLYHFGVLHSTFHNAWMRTVAGRLKSDYRYSGGVVYNNFIFPNASDDQQKAIEQAAQKVLDARKLYPDSTLAELYDPDNDFLFPELANAHQQLDIAVEAAYGVDFSNLAEDKREQAIVNHLFGLYAEKML